MLFTVAKYAEKKPTIDGVITDGEWSENWIGVDEKKSVKLIQDWGGPDDLSFNTNLMWDEEAFYLSAVVRDDVHCVTYTPTGPANMWRGDSIQFAVDDREVISSGAQGRFTELGIAQLQSGQSALHRWSTLYSVSSKEKSWAPFNNSVVDVASVAEADGEKVLSVTSKNSGSSTTAIKYVFPEVIEDGTLDIKYDVLYKKDSNSENSLWITLDKGTDDKNESLGSSYPHFENGDVYVNYNLTADRGTPCTIFDKGSLTENKWYTISLSVKPAESKYSISVADRETGAVIGGELLEQPFEDVYGVVQNKIAQVVFRSYAGEHYFDNIVIKHTASESGFEGVNETFDDWKKADADSIGEKVDVAVTRKEGITIYECRIPWSEIFYEGYAVNPEQSYRFSALVNDNDGEGRRGFIEYTTGIGGNKNAKLHGKMILEK